MESAVWKNPKKWNFFKLINPYSAYQIIYELVYLFTSFLCLRWVLPEEVGIWQTMLLIETYMMFSRFGVFNAFNREFPFFLGKGKNEKALQFLFTAEHFALCLALFFLITIPLSLFFYNPSEEPLWKLSILALTVVAPLNVYRKFLDLTYRTNKDFALLSKVQLRMILILIVSLVLVWKFAYLGYLVRFIFIGIAAISLYSYYRAQPFKPKYNREDFRYLFKEGLPLFGSNYLQNIIKGFPKLIILYYGTFSVLGLFSPVQAILSFGLLIPSSISLYLLPQLNFQYGANDSKQDVIKNGLKAAMYSMVIMLPIVMVLWWIIPPLISTFLPNFIDSIFPMQLALILSFLAAFKISFNVFTVLKEWNKMYVYLGCLFLVHSIIPLLIINFNPNIDLLVLIVASLIIAETIMILISLTTINTIK